MRKISLLLLVCCTVTFTAKAQQKWPSTLLWRISGNGFTEPSYLFGTIHLQRKEVFYFGDSVYAALNKVQGFAMELDPYAMIDAYLEKMFAKDFFGNDDSEEDAPKAEMNTPSKQKNKRGAVQLKNRYNVPEKPDDMATVVDLYLYEKAKSAGKWMGAVEDVEDQLYLVDELGGNANSKPVNEKEEKRMLDSLLKWYTTQNLSKIDYYLNNNYEFDHDFNKRNRKMAFRADSLGRIRSMFFAVGAAHLPGDSGVITLLRQRGFTVTPVFSSRTTAPVQEKFSAAQWVTNWEADSSYLYKTPTVPKVYQLGNVNMDMHISVDLNEMTALTFIAIPYTKPASASKEEHYMLNQLLNNYKKRGTPVYDIRRFTYQNIPALTGRLKYGAYELRLQLLEDKSVLYMMLVSASSIKIKNEELVSAFFNSLDIRKKNLPAEPAWKSFSDSTLGYAVQCPCALKPKKQTSSDSMRVIYNGICYDAYTQKQFGLFVSRINPGFYNSYDTGHFTSYREELNQMALNDFVEIRSGQTQGYPSASFHFKAKEDGLFYHFKLVVKGNYNYILFYGGSDSLRGEEDRYFGSLVMNEFGAAHWARQQHPNGNLAFFAPGTIKVRSTQAEDEQNEVSFYSYDTASATTYYLFQTPYNRFAWFKNDSAWAASALPANSNGSDSVLLRKTFRKNDVPFVEQLKTCGMLNTWKHTLAFPVNDTLFELSAYITRQQYNTEAHQRLFHEITWKQNRPNTLFNNKTEAVFNALRSTDSATFAEAGTQIAGMDCTTADLPLLHKALLDSFPLDNPENYSGTARAIMRHIANLQDSSTVLFIRNNYAQVNDSAHIHKGEWLSLLSEIQTRESYALLKELILNQTPAQNSRYDIAWNIDDSAELAASLFPELATLLRNKTYRLPVVFLMNKLIDSGKISRSLAAEWKEPVYELARFHIKESKNTPDAIQAHMPSLAFLLAKIKTPEALALLNNMATIPSEYLQYNVVEAMLNEQLTPNKNTVQKLAASKSYRVDLYRLLEKSKQAHLFPPALATQVIFGESLLYNYATDEEEWEPEKIQFVKTLTSTIKGKKYRFHVYKLLFDDTEEKKWYTGICGPFSMNDKKPDAVNGESTQWISFDQPFSAGNISALFKQYLEILSGTED
ncbi:MAG: TraB/GumN family protein [Dinghuibacter sp.]|nr:TraB/GumN family protein [Dinghuibacter sp.]